MFEVQNLLIIRQDKDLYDGVLFSGGSVVNYSHRNSLDVLFDLLKNNLEPEEKGVYCMFKNDAMLEVYSEKPLIKNVGKFIQLLYELFGTAWHDINLYSKEEGKFRFNSINLDEFNCCNTYYLNKYKIL